MPRILFFLAALAGLTLAVWSGLQRLGWPLPSLGTVSAAVHGPLMVGGFLGAVIGLERALALNRGWAFLTPALSAVAILALSFDAGLVAMVATFLASAALVGVMTVLNRRHPSREGWILTVGAAAWLVGNGLWLVGWPLAYVLPWWMGYAVLTVAGERLEQNRLLRLPPIVQNLLLAGLTLLAAGMVTALWDLTWGMSILGVAQILIAYWLLVYDVARRRVRAAGQARYVALSLLGGFLWLGFAGGLAVEFGGITAGPAYDAMVHALFMGFVFSMIFGHAPILFPAVLQRSLRYASRFYLHLLLLHGGLLLRLIGDLTASTPLRLWGGLINALAILLFLVNMVLSLHPPERTGPKRKLTP